MRFLKNNFTSRPVTVPLGSRLTDRMICGWSKARKSSSAKIAWAPLWARTRRRSAFSLRPTPSSAARGMEGHPLTSLPRLLRLPRPSRPHRPRNNPPHPPSHLPHPRNNPHHPQSHPHHPPRLHHPSSHPPHLHHPQSHPQSHPPHPPHPRQHPTLSSRSLHSAAASAVTAPLHPQAHACAHLVDTRALRAKPTRCAWPSRCFTASALPTVHPHLSTRRHCLPLA